MHMFCCIRSELLTLCYAEVTFVYHGPWLKLFGFGILFPRARIFHCSVCVNIEGWDFEADTHFSLELGMLNVT